MCRGDASGVNCRGVCPIRTPGDSQFEITMHQIRLRQYQRPACQPRMTVYTTERVGTLIEPDRPRTGKRAHADSRVVCMLPASGTRCGTATDVDKQAVRMRSVASRIRIGVNELIPQRWLRMKKVQKWAARSMSIVG